MPRELIGELDDRLQAAIDRPPDDSIETRAVRRSAWTLRIAIIVGAIILIGSVVLVLTVQRSSEQAYFRIDSLAQRRCDAVEEKLTAQWSMVLEQLNDRLDAQAADIQRVRDRNSDLWDALQECQKDHMDSDGETAENVGTSL